MNNKPGKEERRKVLDEWNTCMHTLFILQYLCAVHARGGSKMHILNVAQQTMLCCESERQEGFRTGKIMGTILEYRVYTLEKLNNYKKYDELINIFTFRKSLKCAT